MTEKLSSAQQRAVSFIQNHSASQLGEIGTQIGVMLAELCAELMDAKSEADHWHKSFDVVSREMKAAVGVAVRQMKAERLVVTRQDLNELGHDGLMLFVGTPTADVRVYELRRQTVLDKQGKPPLKVVQ